MSLIFSMELTVREIAKRVAPDMDATAIKRLVRQLRHWTLAGALKPIGPVSSGVGHHRKYSGESLYIAALLIELSRYRPPVIVMNGLALTFLIMTRGANRPRWATMWQQAKAGEAGIHAAIALGDLHKKGGGADVVLYVPEGHPITLDKENSTIILNLTRLFSGLGA